MNEPAKPETKEPRTAIEVLSHEVERYDAGIETLAGLVCELTGEDVAPKPGDCPSVGCFRAALVQASLRLEGSNDALEELVPRIRALCLG
jgi:hypothetical protein